MLLIGQFITSKTTIFTVRTNYWHAKNISHKYIKYHEWVNHSAWSGRPGGVRGKNNNNYNITNHLYNNLACNYQWIINRRFSNQLFTLKHILQINLDAPGVPDNIKRLHSSEGFIKCNTKLTEESNQIKYKILQNRKLCLEYDR